MELFAIFGDPVAHSRSPLMHNHVFKTLGVPACYTRIHLKEGNKLKATFFDLGLSGANVTVPHKEAAFEACDEVRGFANEVGVVNTLVNENGRLIGYNTDADGFLFSVREFGPLQSVLIIGAGGTAKALASKFKMEGMNVTVLNRSEERLAYFKVRGFETRNWESMEVRPFDLVVNTTSAGLEDESLPAPEALITALLENAGFAADAIYGKVTPFLKLAAKLGKTSKDGADMLLGQGVLANAHFTQERYNLDTIEKTMRESFAF